MSFPAVLAAIVRRSVRPARYSQLGHERTMTLDHAALVQLLEAMKAADVDDRIKLAAQTIYQALIDAELPRPSRRVLPRPRPDLPLVAGTPPPGRPGVVCGDHGGLSAGVSTRKVDDVVKALGIDSGISKSEVSRICADLDVEVAAFRDRSLADIAYPYVFDRPGTE